MHASFIKIVTPESIRPHPKAGPRKASSASVPRRRGETKILTDTPVKRQLETEANLRESKKKKIGKRVEPKSCKSKNGNKRRKKQLVKRRAHTAEDKEPCKVCGVQFGAISDPEKDEDWVKCLHC